MDDASLGKGGLRMVSVGEVDNVKDTVIVGLKMEFYNKYVMFTNVNPIEWILCYWRHYGWSISYKCHD